MIYFSTFITGSGIYSLVVRSVLIGTVMVGQRYLLCCCIIISTSPFHL